LKLRNGSAHSLAITSYSLRIDPVHRRMFTPAPRGRLGVTSVGTVPASVASIFGTILVYMRPCTYTIISIDFLRSEANIIFKFNQRPLSLLFDYTCLPCLTQATVWAVEHALELACLAHNLPLIELFVGRGASLLSRLEV